MKCGWACGFTICPKWPAYSDLVYCVRPVTIMETAEGGTREPSVGAAGAASRLLLAMRSATHGDPDVALHQMPRRPAAPDGGDRR